MESKPGSAIFSVLMWATVTAVVLVLLYLLPNIYLLSLVLDAQAGIGMWFVEDRAMKLLMVSWPFALFFYSGYMWKARWVKFIGVLGLLPVFVISSCSIFQMFRDEKALVKVTNQRTSANELHRYVSYRTAFWGTELQNRIASHPNVSAESLWALLQRGESSTLYCLAKKVDAPPQLLRQLAEHDDADIRNEARKSLFEQRNRRE